MGTLASRGRGSLVHTKQWGTPSPLNGAEQARSATPTWKDPFVNKEKLATHGAECHDPNDESAWLAVAERSTVAQAEASIDDPTKLELGVAVRLVELATLLNFNLELRVGERTADCRSIMQLLLLFSERPTRLTLLATGPGAARTVERMQNVLRFSTARRTAR